MYKQAKDQFIKFIFGTTSAPQGLVELNHYFRFNDPIVFDFEDQEDGSVIAISQNFRHGSIITHAKSRKELDEKIKDAILTAFEVPSSYAKEAGIHRVEEKGYAFA